jgi:hypothetical protein
MLRAVRLGLLPGSLIHTAEPNRLIELTRTPDQETGRAFSYPVANQGLRRTRPRGPRSVVQTASTALRR